MYCILKALALVHCTLYIHYKPWVNIFRFSVRLNITAARFSGPSAWVAARWRSQWSYTCPNRCTFGQVRSPSTSSSRAYSTVSARRFSPHPLPLWWSNSCSVFSNHIDWTHLYTQTTTTMGTTYRQWRWKFAAAQANDRFQEATDAEEDGLNLNRTLFHSLFISIPLQITNIKNLRSNTFTFHKTSAK